jgi:nucleotide-binding universal stress UspA family protein
MPGGHVPRTILVPLDGSRFAELALPLAVSLANRRQARLRLLSVHEPHADIFPGLDAPAIDAERRRGALNRNING